MLFGHGLPWQGSLNLLMWDCSFIYIHPAHSRDTNSLPVGLCIHLEASWIASCLNKGHNNTEETILVSAKRTHLERKIIGKPVYVNISSVDEACVWMYVTLHIQRGRRKIVKWIAHSSIVIKCSSRDVYTVRMRPVIILIHNTIDWKRPKCSIV